MAEIDPEFIDAARGGHFPVNDFVAYLSEEGNEEIRDHVNEAVENGLSIEWAAMTFEQNVSPEIESWDHATISRDSSGEWSVIILDGNGDSARFTFNDEEVAQDLIWADLYFHMTEYGVEFDKDIDSGDSAT